MPRKLSDAGVDAIGRCPMIGILSLLISWISGYPPAAAEYLTESANLQCVWTSAHPKIDILSLIYFEACRNNYQWSQRFDDKITSSMSIWRAVLRIPRNTWYNNKVSCIPCSNWVANPHREDLYSTLSCRKSIGVCCSLIESFPEFISQTLDIRSFLKVLY